MTCDISLREFACYFPFLNKSASYLQKRGYLLDVALSDKKLLEKAVERLKRALAHERIALRPCIDSPEEAAAAARLALYIAAATRNTHVLRRFADSESKNFKDILEKTPGIQSPECKLEIARDLGIVTRQAQEVAPGLLSVAYKMPMAVRWTAYVRYAPQDPYWAMINRPVVKGWVILPIEDFERLLEEAYEERIVRTVSENELAVGRVAASLDPALLDELVKQYGQRPVRVEARAMPGPDPPCMRALIDALKAGENLPHTGRFAITTYLLHRGWDVEQIVDLFRNAPDFNEKITRYQVQHIAGQAGGRKQYSVPSCETMNSWGLCPTNLGCGIRNPVVYGRRVAARKSS
ncbi:Eukaryotic-type DNA primase, large subunit [Pyrobaculum oguniense TE7]|uniref:DNA primase large subunit PriL n=1 Tax=Pyrobaculum oguniense (strain DSM 13380 / JCM 10595 / TE7) TaxID=698757 RepID=H6Q6K8_PYROT|nr:Eukaryotic-type DNA primase, large subunit [Pyrobaculum oguniense TE7]